MVLDDFRLASVAPTQRVVALACQRVRERRRTEPVGLLLLGFVAGVLVAWQVLSWR